MAWVRVASSISSAVARARGETAERQTDAKVKGRLLAEKNAPHRLSEITIRPTAPLVPVQIGIRACNRRTPRDQRVTAA